MPKVTVHGHLPAFLTSSLNRVALSPGEKLPHEAEAGAGSGALEANVKKINLGFLKVKIHRPSSAEIALRERALKVQAKSTPYASTHGALGVRLNGQVQVKPSESSMLSSESVMCRHFAAMFMQRGGKKSDQMQTFSTEAGIAGKFDGKLAEIEVGFNKALKEAPAGCKHVVSSEQLGGYLKAMAMQLQAPGAGEGPSEANCLLHTADHAMALHVQRKRKDGVEYFAAKLYDPNATATYKRVVKANPEDFVSLKLKDMMIRPELISLYTNGANKPLAMVAVSMDHRLQPPMDRNSTVPSAENMHVALQSGLLDEVHSMLETALGVSPVSIEHIELLKAHHFREGMPVIPGLHKAFHGGQCDAIKAFTETVSGSEVLSEQDKVDLLGAKAGNGLPALNAALASGQYDTVKVFTQVVLASGLSPQAKVKLLAAKGSDEVPGLFLALQNGHADAVKAFVHEVLASDLSPQAKVELLAAKRGDGVPGLFLAFQNNHSDAVQAFTQEVLASKELSPEEKVDLLAPKSGDVPGLFTAFQKGNTNTVKVFAQEVLASKNLPPQAKVDLLAAKHSQGVPGLAVAVYKRHDETVSAFAQTVRQSGLEDDQKDQLLSPLSDS